MIRPVFRLTTLLVITAGAAAGIPVLAQSTASQLVTLRHASGQGVAPVYEGFDVNPDGSFNMWFGYMNRNYEEFVEVPVGADNRFEPGGDRGQPTSFVPRRHKDVFSVKVPKDFGDRTVVWTLTAHGQTASVTATLNPVWQIDRRRTTRGGNSENISSNLPPVVNAKVVSQNGVTATLGLDATDDGLPKRRGEPVGMTVLWAKYRGPGDVSFADAQSKLAGGRATTTATFSQPGEYILQAVVDDGSGESAGNFGYHCCWTNAQLTVRVPAHATHLTDQTHASNSTHPTDLAHPTYAKDVAPIFQQKCQACHHQGTSAPMSLVTYDEVRPWARSIRQRVANRDMPPWHLDKTVGIKHYKNDRSLSDAEIAVVTKWADSGAPLGNPADMPPPLSFRSEAEWFIGEPDLKVTTPNDFVMYSKGPDWWIDQFSDVIELSEDRWIKAMEIKPSNPKIVHHVVVYVLEPDAPEGTPETGIQLHEYAVGKYGDIFGHNTGRLLKKGTRLRFDMHYFAIGSEQHNKTTIAFKFYPRGVVPKYQVRSYAIRNIPNDELEVPPNTVVRTDGYFRLPRNARIDSFQPHMHMRGRGMTVEAIDPANNRTQILSSVDHFDFNWHINYVYADDEAPLLPAGTVLHMIGIHDNTAANRRNPDPNMWVGFGERSVDDMLQVWLDIVYLDDAEYQRLVENRKHNSQVSTLNSQEKR